MISLNFHHYSHLSDMPLLSPILFSQTLAQVSDISTRIIHIYICMYIYMYIYIYKYTFIYPGCVWKWGMPPISSHFHRENDDEKSMDFGIPCFQTNLSGLFACSGLVFTTRWSHAKRSAHAAYKRMLGLCPKMSSMHLTYAPDHGHYKMTLSCVKHRWFVNLKSLLRITLGNCLYKWSI